MKMIIQPFAASIALFCAMSQPLFAQETATKGTVCWTGDITYVATGEADMGYVWSIDWTYLPDDANQEMNAGGECHGSGFVIGGTPEVNPYFCKHIRSDGATYMTRVEANDAGGTSSMYGGTGAMAGAMGEAMFGAIIPMPSADGKLAGCRTVEGSYTTAG